MNIIDRMEFSKKHAGKIAVLWPVLEKVKTLEKQGMELAEIESVIKQINLLGAQLFLLGHYSTLMQLVA